MNKPAPKRKKPTRAKAKANPLAQFLAVTTVVLIATFFIQSALQIHEADTLSVLGERLGQGTSSHSDQ